jgi:hypothetical protein
MLSHIACNTRQQDYDKGRLNFNINLNALIPHLDKNFAAFHSFWS